MQNSEAVRSSHLNEAHRLRAQKHRKIAVFLAPIMFFSFLFVYFPFLKTVLYSVCSVNDRGEIRNFVGLENFLYVFRRSDFLKALRNTLLLTGINVPCTLILALALARLCVKKRMLSPIYETMFMLPMSVSMSAACMIFKSMLSPTLGFINAFFSLDLGWFESRNTALYSCLLVTVWMGIGFDFLLFQTAFRSIPRQILEAAELDGVSFFSRLLKIELPLISPTIFYVLCSNTVLAMMTSAPMIIITQGGPSYSTTTLMYMMYASGYGSSNYSLAAVVSLTAFLLALLFTVFALFAERRSVFYQ